MGADWLRCVSPYFWINEIYTNSFFYTTPDILPEDLRFRIWTYVAGGAKGVVFWQYRSERVGNESGCSGLVGIDGTPTVRTASCSAEAARIRQHEEVLRAFQPDPAEVAVVYDLESDLMSRIEETTGQNFLGNTVKYSYKAALKGAYNLLWRNRIPLDFITTRDLEGIHRYRLVYVPALFVADARLAEILDDYVRQGGFLVAEEGIALRDKRYWMNPMAPGSGLDRLFGATQGKTSKTQAPIRLEFGADALPVSGRRAILHPCGGQVLAEWPDGGAAMVTNIRGKGIALLLGFHPGQCHSEAGVQPCIQMARLWLQDAGVEPGIRFDPADRDAAAVEVVEQRVRFRVVLLETFGAVCRLRAGHVQVAVRAEIPHRQLGKKLVGIRSRIRARPEPLGEGALVLFGDARANVA